MQCPIGSVKATPPTVCVCAWCPNSLDWVGPSPKKKKIRLGQARNRLRFRSKRTRRRAANYNESRSVCLVPPRPWKLWSHQLMNNDRDGPITAWQVRTCGEQSPNMNQISTQTLQPQWPAHYMCASLFCFFYKIFLFSFLANLYFSIYSTGSCGGTCPPGFESSTRH